MQSGEDLAVAPMAGRVQQHLGEGQRVDDERVDLGEDADRRESVGIAVIEPRDEHAGVDDGHCGHSSRSDSR